MMFAIKVEVSDPWAEMVPLSAQKTFRQVEACPSFSATASIGVIDFRAWLLIS